jgi:REP-associated tyrosine transposase
VSLPRAVFKGRTYLLTRRCSERRFFLRPGKKTNQAFVYCLAEAANRHGIRVHAVLAMSNHYHAVISDPRGRYPRFIEHFHKMLAKCLNVHWGRWEALWASEPTSVVELVGPWAIWDKIIYALCNPVAAGLVARATDWPGVTSLGKMLSGRSITARRPTWFFDRAGKMPAVVELELHRPAGFDDLSHSQWADKLRGAIAAREAQLATARRKAGRSVLGRKAVLAQSAFDCPASHAPRRGMSPRVAAANKWRRIEALQRNRGFVEVYRDAWERLTAGARDVVFPLGTYKLALHGLVRCGVPPA